MSCDVCICTDHEDLNKKIVIPEEDRFLNTLIIGATGTGKTSQVIEPMIFQDMINDDCGITIIDPKEDLAESIYGFTQAYPGRNKIYYLNPTSKDSPKINPFSGEETTVIKNLIKILSPSFITKSNEEKQSLDVCRNLISKSIKLLKRFPELSGKELNIVTYSEFITNKYNEARKKISKVKDNLDQHDRDPEMKECCDWFIYKYFETESIEYILSAPVRIKVVDIAENTFLSRTLCPKQDVDSEIIDFNEVIANGEMVIVNTQNTILGNLGKTFGEFIMLMFLNAVFNRKHYAKEHKINTLKPHFLYVDEFATFSPVLTEMFTQGRSFKIGTIIAVQNRALLRMCGELDTTAQSLLIESNARNIILFPGLNGEDADYYSKQFFNLKPEEICYRPFGQVCYRIVSNRNILPPGIGLTFFVDEKTNNRSLLLEQKYYSKGVKTNVKNTDGN